MKILVTTLLVSLTLLNADEHSSHVHKHGPQQEDDSKFIMQMEESQSTIEKNAKKKIQTLVQEKKIPKSWAFAPMLKMEKTKNKTNDWKVSFSNLKITHKTKQTLYVFVSAYGKVVGVNYTGK